MPEEVATQASGSQEENEPVKTDEYSQTELDYFQQIKSSGDPLRFEN